ncbi:hypothetical protein PanWU01x14_317830 [Parasponia andersonii]|uniref:Uncharacterized protein n=1 Tax=Parasponia andersonii TaxID=3476 RepID=A0A2P5AMF7_PARAD|nr:hypothetical protein PanWU01x14_317830 [Parasponia andersonii]
MPPQTRTTMTLSCHKPPPFSPKYTLFPSQNQSFRKPQLTKIDQSQNPRTKTQFKGLGCFTKTTCVYLRKFGNENEKKQKIRAHPDTQIGRREQVSVPSMAWIRGKALFLTLSPNFSGLP